MTENPKRQLGERLAALTRWRGERTELWREALAATDRDDTPGKTLPQRWLTAPAWRVAAVFVVLAPDDGTATLITFKDGERRWRGFWISEIAEILGRLMELQEREREKV